MADYYFSIPLTQGYEAIVDATMYDSIAAYRWYAAVMDGVVYAFRHDRVDGKRVTIPMQRDVLGLRPGDGIVADHVDGNKLNNRLCNLRKCTQAQNTRNKRVSKNNQLGLKGVTTIKRKRSVSYRATIEFKKRRFTLGCFKSPEEAAKAYDTKARELFGEFAWVNFP